MVADVARVSARAREIDLGGSLRRGLLWLVAAVLWLVGALPGWLVTGIVWAAAAVQVGYRDARGVRDDPGEGGP